MKNFALGSLGSVALAILLNSSCLPADTRPPPTKIRTDFALGPQQDTDLSDGLTLTTADGYEVTLSRILLSFGRVKFSGDGCNSYGDQAGFYARVLSALQPGQQDLSLKYALGECEMQYRMYPPEDWAHIENPEVSEADRDELRAVEFDSSRQDPGREESDDFAGPRGPKGASLIVEGFGRRTEGEEEPTAFRFEFGTTSFAPDCDPDGEEFFQLTENGDLSLVVEMFPEQLFGTCGDNEDLRFAPIARARQLVPEGEPVTLTSLEELKLSELSEDGEPEFYECDRTTEIDPTSELFEELTGSNTSSAQALLDGDSPPFDNLREWLASRARFDLFGVRGAECTWQGETFEEQF